MVVISYRTIKEFIVEHPDAEDALNNWYTIAEKSDWANFNEVRETFGSADAVGSDLYVFNIKGNHYRLIVWIIFRVRTIYIKFIGTHKQYDQVNLDKLWCTNVKTYKTFQLYGDKEIWNQQREWLRCFDEKNWCTHEERRK